MKSPTRNTPRETLLSKALSREHRYVPVRAATQAVTLLTLYLVPLTGLARFDLWSGRHASLGREVGAFDGFVATVVGIAVFYLVTFLLNFVYGRLFCGWGCPLAQFSRLGERLELAQRSRRGRLAAGLRAHGFGVALSGGVLLWWVHPLVFVEGGLLALTLTLLALAGMCALSWLHGRAWRWAFCRKVCPIGLYYSVVTMETAHGIVYEDEWGTCKDCHACERVCPVSLDPRELSEPRDGIGGLAIDGLPGRSHCLTCGDCVQVCEHVFRREPDALVPLHFGFGRAGRPLEEPDEARDAPLDRSESAAVADLSPVSDPCGADR